MMTALYRIEFGPEGHEYVLQRVGQEWRVSRGISFVESYSTAYDALNAIKEMFEYARPCNDEDEILFEAIKDIL